MVVRLGKGKIGEIGDRCGVRRPPRRSVVTMLRVDAIRKRFGPVTALDACSFTVARGRMLGFLGPNGAGKTTTMRAIFGLVELDAGAVLWDGDPIGPVERLPFRDIPEERGLNPRMRVGEQLAYLGRLHGLDAHAAHAAASDWLTPLGLAERARAQVVERSHDTQHT